MAQTDSHSRPSLTTRAHTGHGPIPRHVGIVLDGNRRWARERGYQDISEGHRIGFGKIPDVLSWCDAAGIQIVTWWRLPEDNVKTRSHPELDALFEIDEDVVRKLHARRCFRVRFIGAPEILPERLVKALREAEDATRHLPGMQVNLGIA